MSLKDKASKIDFRSLPGAGLPSSGEASAPLPRPKTAPGLMMAQAADQRSELLRENESLKLKVQDLGAAASRAGELEEERVLRVSSIQSSSPGANGRIEMRRTSPAMNSWS